MRCLFSGKRVNGQQQPHHALQPGARVQQILWEEGEGEAQQLSARVTRWVVCRLLNAAIVLMAVVSPNLAYGRMCVPNLNLSVLNFDLQV